MPAASASTDATATAATVGVPECPFDGAGDFSTQVVDGAVHVVHEQGEGFELPVLPCGILRTASDLDCDGSNQVVGGCFVQAAQFQGET